MRYPTIGVLFDVDYVTQRKGLDRWTKSHWRHEARCRRDRTVGRAARAFDQRFARSGATSCFCGRLGQKEAIGGEVNEDR